MTRLFDAYIAVDWSASNAPSRRVPCADAVWTAEFVPADGQPTTRYFRTRAECRDHLARRLSALADRGLRVFAGFDFSLGYPAGWATALGLTGEVPAWRAIWNELRARVTSDSRNRNNRFAVASALNALAGPEPGPFWGCPPRRQTATLLSTSPRYPYEHTSGAPLARLRLTEQRLKGVQPSWKLLGVGSVGSQALTGIPVVAELRDDPALTDMSNVWPFETGFTAAPQHAARIVFAEIWPGTVTAPIHPPLPIRDQTQVRDVTEWLASLDDTGRLGTLFATPDGLDADDLATCQGEEGWILGVS